MKTFFKKIEIETSKRFDFVNIEQNIREILKESQIKQGMLLLLCSHTTAGLILNEDDSTIHRDFEKIAKILVPGNLNYEHVSEGKINAMAHQLSMIFGNSLTLVVRQGNLFLGTWQSIFFVEFLEARKREVAVLILGE